MSNEDAAEQAAANGDHEYAIALDLVASHYGATDEPEGVIRGESLGVLGVIAEACRLVRCPELAGGHRARVEGLLRYRD